MVFKSWLLIFFYFFYYSMCILIISFSWFLVVPPREREVSPRSSKRIFMYIYWCEWTLHFVTIKYLFFFSLEMKLFPASIHLEIPSQFSTQVTVFCLWMTQFCYFNLFIIFLYFSLFHSFVYSLCSVISSFLLLRVVTWECTRCFTHQNVFGFDRDCGDACYYCVHISYIFVCIAFAFLCCRFT